MVVYSLISVVLLKIQSLIKGKKKYILTLLVLSIITAIYNSQITLDVGLTDSYVYKIKYLELVSGGNNIINDLGFDYFSLLSARLNIPLFWYFLIIVVFQLVVISKFAIKYSANPILSMIIYLLTYYNQHNYNIIRQGMAVSFTIIAVDLLINNKKIKSILFAIVAVLFHKSAILVFIIYILKKDNNFKSKSIYYLTGLTFTFVFTMVFNKLINKLILYMTQFNLFGDKYNNYSIGSFFMEYRMTYLYILATLFLVVLTFLIIKSLPFISSEQYFIFKIFYIGVIFSLLFSSSVIFRRLGNYFLIYQCILVPNIINVFKEKRIVEYGLLLLYVVQAIV